MRIACIGYRDWALKIYDKLARTSDHQFMIFRSKVQYNERVLRDFKPELVLFYGWSWIIHDTILTDFKCLMLHPSPLPKYRGGSPIQNQIIAGEKQSAVTLFIMDKGIDTGPIVGQQAFSLEGGIDEIFSRITSVGFELTQDLLINGLNPVPQNNKESTTYRRRKPQDSEITSDELNHKPAEFLYNKIRMLQNPYPNAYIKTADGKKLILLDARIEE